MRQLTSLSIALLTACSAATVPAGQQPAEALSQPNIIFILVDDMGYSDIGCYGGEIKTPNLDRLADNGLRFTQMHNTAKCFPSRATLLTGLYAQDCGMSMRYDRFTQGITLGEALKGAGYRTLASGKHHSGESLYDRGFDRYFGLLDGANNHFNPGLPREGEPKPAQKAPGRRHWAIDAEVLQPYTPPEKDFYSTDHYTQKAIDYLEEYKDEESPFFLYLAYTAPHDPLQAWPEDIAKYADTYQVGYAAMIDRIDQKIGELIVKLEALGEFENTLILFAADNGSSAEMAENLRHPEGKRAGDGLPLEKMGGIDYWASLGRDWANVSNTPFRNNKASSYEGGTCTPFIAHWPDGIQNPGAINHAFVGHFIDVMPTLVELAGAEYPTTHNDQTVPPMAGESFAAQLKGDLTSKRTRTLYWEFSRGRAIRQGDWKAVAENSDWQLFDMSSDRNETNDLSKQYPERLAAMQQQWTDWYDSTSAPPLNTKKRSSKK